MSPQPMVPLTLESLEDRCRHWQRVLRLQDWNVATTVARFDEIEGLGDSSISNNFRNADIRVLATADVERRPGLKAGRDACLDWEVTLVHELLHLHLHDVTQPKSDTPELVALERAIETVAIALVSLDRSVPARSA